VFPAQVATQRQLADAEVAELGDDNQEGLRVLQEGASHDADPDLADAVERKIGKMANTARDLALDEGDVFVGNEISEQVLLRGLGMVESSNSVRDIKVKKGTIRVGNNLLG